MIERKPRRAILNGPILRINQYIAGIPEGTYSGLAAAYGYFYEGPWGTLSGVKTVGDFGDEVTGIRGDDAGAEHAVAGFIEDQFGEPFGATHADGFNGVDGLTQARGVDEPKMNAAQGDLVFNDITGGTGNF